MHPRHGSAFSCFALLLGACGSQQAPTAQSSAPVATPAPIVAPANTPGVRPGEPIAEYVVAAFTDSKGVRWFGTMGKGVARFDGETLRYLSPAGGEGGDVVASITEDRSGTLWFAGHDGTGLSRYDGEKFTQIWAEETRVRADRAGEIWASTRRQVLRLEGDSFKEFTVPLGDVPAPSYSVSPGRVAMELLDSRGHRWFRSDGYGVFRHDGKSFTRFTKKDGLCSDTVWSIVEDTRGQIWLGCTQASQPRETGDGGVCRYDGETFTTFPEVKGLAGNDIFTLFPDRAGNLWIGASRVGVYRHDGERFTLFDQTERPDLNGGFGLQGMTEDREGELWFAFSGGLFRLDGQRFVHVAQDGPWK